MIKSFRILIGSIVVCPSVYCALHVSLRLPLNLVDSVLTAGMVGFFVFTAILCWVAQAYKLLIFGVKVFVPASILVTALLFLHA